jgi:hypothetical protein
MNRLLKLAEFMCGERSRHRTFEPMLADWQRELTNAKGPRSLLRALASGGFGFIRALLFCAMCEGVWIPPLHGTLLSLAAITTATAVSIGVVLLAPPPAHMPRDLSLLVVQHWVLTWTVTIVPPAFLLSTFLLRADPRATIRHCIVFTIVAAAATSVLIVNTTDDALRKRFDSFEMYEQARAVSLERHRAGQLVYTGSSYQQEISTTVDQRRIRYERFVAQMQAFRRNDPPPTWSERFRQWSPLLFAVVFAITGWLLAGFGIPTITRGAAWWTLVFAAIVAMTRMLSYLVGIPMPRPPQWVILPIFASVMLALMIGARTIRKPQLG